MRIPLQCLSFSVSSPSKKDTVDLEICFQQLYSTNDEGVMKCIFKEIAKYNARENSHPNAVTTKIDQVVSC